jgi:Ca2+-binding RTX toxin-like protein
VLVTTNARDKFVSVRQSPTDADTWQIRTRRNSFEVSGSSTGQVIIDAERIRRFELQLPSDGSELPAIEFRGDTSRWLMTTVLGTGSDDNIAVSGDRDKLTVAGNGASAVISGTYLAVISGRDGNDRIDGSGVEDLNLRIYGGNGDDILLGGSGHDSIFGGNGDDFLSGGSGNDWLFGGWGNDLLAGNAGRDRMFGGFGSDVLIGGSGRDFLNGGFGRDYLAGGPGRDIMVRGQRVDPLFAEGVDRETKAERLDALWNSSIDVEEILDNVFDEH